MAAHYVAIAKASFAAGLLRPDPASVSRDEIGRFHTLLDETLQKCSVPNVQKCKVWIVENIVPSSARTTALGKYLAALSASLEKDEYDSKSPSTGPIKSKSLAARKRLHIIYLLNDLLHDAKYHQGARPTHASLTSNLQPQLVSIFGSAAAYDFSKYPKQHKRLNELLHLWKDDGYYSEQYIQKLIETVTNGGSVSLQKQDQSNDRGNSQDQQSHNLPPQHAKNLPYIMPASHGDQSTPYYDLPAGNLMPHIIPNSTAPINPQMVKPLLFVAGPADQSLTTAVRDLLEDVRTIYDSNLNEGIVDVDEMGQPMFKDELTGESKPSEGYYGWSIEFCERMKKRKRGETHFKSNGDDRGRSRGRDRSSSYSRSVTPRKRRHDSSSSNDRRSRSGIRYHSRSHSRSRTSSRDSRFSRTPPRRGRRSRSRSQDRSRQSNKRAPTQSRSGDTSDKNFNSFYPFPQVDHALMPSSAASMSVPMDQANSYPAGILPAPTLSQTSQFQHNFTVGPSGVPIPPPPPYHVGPWPPPPPPLPSNMPPTLPANFAQQLAAFASMAQTSPPSQQSSWPEHSPLNLNQINSAFSQSQSPPVGPAQNQTWKGPDKNWTYGQNPQRR